MRLAITTILSLILLGTFSIQSSAQSSGGQASGGPAEEVYSVKEVTKKAVVIEKPEPEIPFHSSDQEVCGVVRLRAVLSSAGEVTNISVVKELADWVTVKEKSRERAIEAARKIKFVPAQKDGRPVSQWVTLEFNFNADCYTEMDPVTRAVTILSKPMPEYTEEARKNRIGGVVTLRVVFSRRGKVLVDSVVDGLPFGLTEKAIEAARKIKFTPAEVKGRKISQFQTVQYKFPEA